MKITKKYLNELTYKIVGCAIVLSSIMFLISCNNRVTSTSEEINYSKDSIPKLLIAEKEILQIQIGEQIWMGTNLAVVTYRNGDSIPEGDLDTYWKVYGMLGRPAFCSYNYKTNNNGEYGKLYNWFAVDDSRGLCPEGWKIPTDNDWNILTQYLGGFDVAGMKLKAADDWFENIDGTNEIGFNGYPGGFRDSDGTFYTEGLYYGNWWTASENSDSSAWSRTLSFLDNKIHRYSIGQTLKSLGFSVRCIKE
jgi:uncharacterized protein (TIGR02145 family)